MTRKHIVSGFDRDLAAMAALIVEMGEAAARQLGDALTALDNRDTGLARRVVANDDRIDTLESEVDRAALHLITLRQPMAEDVRRTLAVLRIAPDIERIGDYGKNIAKRCIALAGGPGHAADPPALPRHRILVLGRRVVGEVEAVIGAFAGNDPAAARQVWERDMQTDHLYEATASDLLGQMMAAPGLAGEGVHLLFIAKNIERIGDLATNIAERVYFQAVGADLDGERPKLATVDLAPPPGRT